MACPWDAGARVEDHVLNAVVTLADGRIIRQEIRTKGLPYAEHVDVNVIHITALVKDSDGNYVRDLEREAFRVTDRGVRQNVSYFAPAGNVPLEIIVAVDISGSMSDAMPQVKSAVKKFVSALRPADQQRLMAFNDSPITLAGPASRSGCGRSTASRRGAERRCSTSSSRPSIRWGRKAAGACSSSSQTGRTGTVTSSRPRPSGGSR